jgi:hypothetical protein
MPVFMEKLPRSKLITFSARRSSHTDLFLYENFVSFRKPDYLNRLLRHNDENIFFKSLVFSAPDGNTVRLVAQLLSNTRRMQACFLWLTRAETSYGTLGKFWNGRDVSTPDPPSAHAAGRPEEVRTDEHRS